MKFKVGDKVQSTHKHNYRWGKFTGVIESIRGSRVAPYYVLVNGQKYEYHSGRDMELQPQTPLNKAYLKGFESEGLPDGTEVNIVTSDKSEKGNKMIIVKANELLHLNIDGVRLNLALDYSRKLVSFVDDNGKAQRYLFANRTVEYLGGWTAIFDAMKKATIYANTLLREQEAKSQSAKLNRNLDIFRAYSDLDKKL